MADIPGTGAKPLLSLHNINMTFGGVKALKNVSFEVLPGEVHCLAGENGCGKSTLIKIITGVYRPEDGAVIEYDGQTYSHMSPVTAQASGIQVIWQDLALFPEMTVAENIAFQTVIGRWPRLVNYRTMRDIAVKALQRLGVALDVDAPLKDYSIAQRQIVAIARALVGEAKLVFMDEPTASLTQSETDHLLEIVRSLSASGVAVVFVSHRLAEVLEISNRLTVLRDGALVGVYPVEGMTQSRVTELMTGKNFDQQVRAKSVRDNPVVLEVKRLSRPGQFHDISFNVRQRRNARHNRPAGRRTHGTRAGALRHAQAPVRLCIVAWQAGPLFIEPRCDQGGHRLSLRRPPVARAHPAAVDRRQSGDSLPRSHQIRRALVR